jgi:hypothetical protein
VTREARIQTLSTKTLAPCAQNLILRLEALTSTTCNISQIIDFFFNAFSICGTQEFIFFHKVGTHLSFSTNLALISSRIIFKVKAFLSKSMHEVQMKSHEQATLFTSNKASTLSQEVWQASTTSYKEHFLQGMYFISPISALACSSSSTHVV